MAAGLLGAAAGGLIGAVIGSQITVWRLKSADSQAQVEIGIEPANVGIAGRVRLRR